MQVRPIKTRVFRENENLEKFIQAHVKKLKEGSVLVVTSKIVALSEGRTVDNDGQKAEEKLIRAESESAIKTKYVWLTIRDNMVMANAGIDASNADGKLVLLPKDSFKAAKRLRDTLKKHYKLKNLGVLITDSRVYPLRAGVSGVALGYFGFRGIRDYRGKSDIFGRTLVFTQTNIADCLSSAAILEMGEGNEHHPLAVIEDAPITYCNKMRRGELPIPPKDDMYLPFLSGLARAKKK